MSLSVSLSNCLLCAGALKRKAHLAAKPSLPPEVQNKYNALLQAGTIRSNDLDKRCLDVLASLHPAKALAVLDRYASKDFSDVRNPAALFMATVKQVDSQAGAGDWADGSRGGSRGGYGDRGGGRGGYGDRSAAPHRGPPYGDPHHPPPQHRPPPPAGPGFITAGQAGPASGGLAALAGVLAGAGGVLAAQSGPGGAAAGGITLPPGVQLPPGVITLPAGVQPGSVISSAGLQQQYLLSANGVLQPLSGTILGAAPAAAGGGLAVQPIPAVQAIQPSAAVQVAPPGVPPEWAAGRKQYGAEQAQLGVRVAEFHGLSPFAVFVHPSPALKLQQLWDEGNELVSMLDDKVWQVLAETPAPEALAIIEEAGNALNNPHAQIRNINAYFMSVVRKVTPASGRRDFHPSGGYDGRDGGRDHSRGYRSDRDYDHRERHGGRDHDYRGDRDRGGDYRGGGNYGRDDHRGSGGGPPQRNFSRQPAIHLLPPDQLAKAKELCIEHAPLLREDHFDEGVIDSLKRLAPGDAMRVLQELGQNSMAGVRNLPAYIMGICMRYNSGHGGGGPRGGRGY
eukprot:GHRR01026265.1.p1 GENE.GHRR01026265.1~~GHRR01026265.1.p1  ORF type:complete len:565 (+),score=204.87 GHRR01026265.1:162-1856(+)